MLRKFSLILLALLIASTMMFAQDAKDGQVVVIKPVGDEMKFETTEFTVKTGTKVKLVMDNIATLDQMKHNVVILKPGADKQKVGMAGLSAGADKEYIPDHESVMFYTALAGAGEKTEVEFVAPAPGKYPYICTFPGHFALMTGVMIVTE